MTGPQAEAETARLEERLDAAIERLARTRIAKAGHVGPVLDLARRLLARPGGVERLAALAGAIDEAGLFAGTDWDIPGALLPNLVANTMRTGTREQVTIEALSELRILAIAEGRHRHAGMAPDAARHFLTQVLALNLERLFGAPSEADRQSESGPMVDALFRFLLERIGVDDILGSLVDEVWRILGQRPVAVGPVKAMITQISLAAAGGGLDLGSRRHGADRLISALFGPTQECRDDPGIPAYLDRVAALDEAGVRAEAQGFARAMHDTGLVSDYHAAFLRWAVEQGPAGTVSLALGLGETALDAYRRFETLVLRLIVEAVHPATAQAAYGLALMLERGILHDPPVTASLWRQIGLGISDAAAATLRSALGDAAAPRVHLLAGVLSVLGQPLGVGQGNNPTCQSARAISLWSLNDPDYLLHLVAGAARRDRVAIWFEGSEIRSDLLPPGMARFFALDTDAVSLVLVPHLDRIYTEMGRLCAGRGDDPHRWVNPELHGWWVARSFCLAVDLATGLLADHPAFLRRFYASYHPEHNGGQDLIHPQPAGVAVTDSTGAFVGWHAIAIIRVAPDQEGVMRVYFYNPNNDSGQEWGGGVRVSTGGCGERHGESSLPFAAFASRLYLFHDVGSDAWETVEVPADEIASAERMAAGTWAAARQPLSAAKGAPPGPWRGALSAASSGTGRKRKPRRGTVRITRCARPSSPSAARAAATQLAIAASETIRPPQTSSISSSWPITRP